MESRTHNIGFALAFVGLLMGPLAVRADGGELMPYAMKECRKLADALARSVPIPKPFATKQAWFREGDLGLKGEQCRISAEGVAKKAEGAKAPLAMADIARALGVTELVIGILLVALATSLPELAVSLVSALKGEYGLALGNIVGSNTFNSLAVIGIAAIIHPAALPPSVLSLHIFVLVAFTLVLFAMTYDYDGKAQISRLEGAALLAAFLAYDGYVAIQSF